MNGFTTGRLVEPKTRLFYDKVHKKAKVIFRKKYPKKRHSFEMVWIGINAKRGPWVYTSSRTKLKFENWGKGQPNNDAHGTHAHDCVNFNVIYGQWTDFHCGSKFYFICEFF